jgi:hypothetical protein
MGIQWSDAVTTAYTELLEIAATHQDSDDHAIAA